METTRLSSKGQIILPKAVRDMHHWAHGTEFSVEDIGDGVILRPVKTRPLTRLDDVVGSLQTTGPAQSIEQMDTVITAELQDRHGCG